MVNFSTNKAFFRNNQNINFGQANVNIMALSDTHGNIRNVAPLYNNFEVHQDEIFKEKNSPSTMNLFAIVGDWFMNPTQRGFLTDRTKTTGDYQRIFLQEWINKAKAVIPGLNVLYTPGNHCLDGGDKAFLNNVKNVDMDIVMSNSEFQKSALYKDLPENMKERFSSFKILEVPDDKNPDLKHKVLVIGILPVNLSFLVKAETNGLNMVGVKNKKEFYLSDDDIKQTAETLDKIVEKFKKENPKSAVMLMNHSGEQVAFSIARQVKDIDLILNAHDHLDKLSFAPNKNGKTTRVVCLSQNAHKIEAVKMHFDDDGNLSVSSNPLYTDFKDIGRNNPFLDLYYKSFEQDLIPLMQINDPKGRKEISIDNIRYGNNDLANFCTDAILDSIRKKYPQVNIFAIGSTAFRENLPTNKQRAVLNIDLIDVFKGIAGDQSTIMVGELTGKELGSFIYENLEENFCNKTRNAINQYSGVIIDLKAIEKTINETGKLNINNPKQVYPFIKVRNESGNFETIDPKKKYQVALPKKLFMKSSLDEFRRKEKDFLNTQEMVCDYFNCFVTRHQGSVKLNLDNRMLA